MCPSMDGEFSGSPVSFEGCRREDCPSRIVAERFYMLGRIMFRVRGGKTTGSRIG